MTRSWTLPLFLFLVIVFLPAGSPAQEETMEEVPATQFEPVGNSLILPQLQVYPVLAVYLKDVGDSPPVFMSYNLATIA